MTKVLVVGQTPPPYHGQAIMIQRLVESKLNDVELIHVPLRFSSSMDEIGRVRVSKIAHLAVVVFRIVYHLWWKPLHHKQFNDQDKYAVAHMEDFYARYDGWNTEFLFRQDAVLTKWRKFASENARAVQPRTLQPSNRSLPAAHP